MQSGYRFYRHAVARILFALTLTLASNVHADVLKAGDIAPDFTLAALDKKPIALKDLLAKGHVMLIFWEPQCVYCYSHLKDFNALQKKYQGKLTLAGINFLGEHPQDIQKYATNNNVEYLLLADRLNNIDVAEAYRIVGSPTIILIHPNGKILSVGYEIPDVSRWIK